MLYILSKISETLLKLKDGHALGGGLELALNCDFRMCTQTVNLALPETGLAIIPGATGTQMLPRMVGLSRAKRLILTGERLDYTGALESGLVDYSATDYESALQKSLEICEQFGKKV